MPEGKTNGRYRHGKEGCRIYKVWANMRQRCNNPKNPCYKDYGGRGISICSEWDDFSVFYRDMGEPPTDKHTLDRIDNNGGYEPGNCKWATRKEQRQNQRPTSRTQTGVIGVLPYRDGNRFVATVCRNKRPVHIGIFDTIAEAAAARKGYIKARAGE